MSRRSYEPVHCGYLYCYNRFRFRHSRLGADRLDGNPDQWSAEHPERLTMHPDNLRMDRGGLAIRHACQSRLCRSDSNLGQLRWHFLAVGSVWAHGRHLSLLDLDRQRRYPQCRGDQDERDCGCWRLLYYGNRYGRGWLKYAECDGSCCFWCLGWVWDQHNYSKSSKCQWDRNDIPFSPKLYL